MEINSHSAPTKTSRIDVSWIVDGNKKTIWSKGKADTDNEAAHAQVAANLKEAQ